MHGVYLGGIFYAIDRGMPSGISSLVVSLQPFFTAVIAWFLLREKLEPVRAVFFMIALFGVFLVLFPDLDLSATIPGINSETLIASFIATFGISLAAVYQKKYVVSLNLWVSTTGQFAGAILVVGIMALLTESMEVNWSGEMIGALLWLVFVLSIGAVGLLMYLIRRGNTASTASLFFLVPVSASIMAWFLFGETMNIIQITGGVIVVLSVAISTRLVAR